LACCEIRTPERDSILSKNLVKPNFLIYSLEQKNWYMHVAWEKVIFYWIPGREKESFYTSENEVFDKRFLLHCWDWEITRLTLQFAMIATVTKKISNFFLFMKQKISSQKVDILLSLRW
jgi:hypothetical protein